MYKLVVPLLLLVACTKPNPNRCCTDEADCSDHGIPVGSTCEAGLVCRGNQCISEPCTSASDCEASAPYCVAELCAESCSDDTQCPGFGQPADDRYCVDGACQECRSGMADDCSADAPICDQGACRPCRSHDECSSGVCASDGQCADESAIAYVTVSGSASSDCTKASPCNSIDFALTRTPARKYVVVGSGTYTSTETLLVAGERWIIGAGTAPVLARTNDGPIVTIEGGSNVRLENLEVAGATGTGTDETTRGNGIIFHYASGPPSVELRHVAVRDNAVNGLYGLGVTLTAIDSAFTNNTEIGASLSSSTGTFDRCLVSGNQNGLFLDGGLYSVTNSFIVRNVGEAARGIELYSQNPGQRIEFNTIADNIDTSGANVGYGFLCNVTAQASFPNNIIARNTRQTSGANCTYPGSIVIDTDITPLKFRSPDMAPYDYHVTAGSIAIDMATQSTLDHDVDGDPRATPRDVGADEYVP